MSAAIASANPLRTATLTTAAMIAFAANSLLCRAALGEQLIDPASFASVRVLAAAAVLLLVVALRQASVPRRAAFDWRASLLLFGYVAFFTFAYTRLSTGTGALILFGAVQCVMFAAALRSGERFPVVSWLGLLCAIAGLVWLLLPGIAAPDPFAAALMLIAGAAWAGYSLRGRGVRQPAESNAANFLACVPLVLAVSMATLPIGGFHVSAAGLFLAGASGALASGLGYVIWYAALSGLSAGRAAAVQLTVPAIAAGAGVVLLGEPVTWRLVFASLAILGGVALALTRRPVGR